LMSGSTPITWITKM